MYLTNLPIELLEQILCHIEAIKLSSLRILSRQFCALIDGSIELQLRIEAAADGFLLHQSSNHANGGLVTRELYDALLASRRAMNVLKPLQTWRYDCWNNVTFMFEICDNTWAHTANVIDTYAFKSITYVDMNTPRLKKDAASSTPEVPTVLGRTAELDVSVSDFAFLPACDLQVLVEPVVCEQSGSGRLHLRTISTNEPHPMAARSIIELPDRSEQELQRCEVLLYENRLVLVFNRSRHRGNITALDWKTGEVLMSHIQAIDAAFLPRDHLMLLRDGNPAYVVIYSFSERAITHQLNLPLQRISQPIDYAIFLTHPSDHYGSQAPPGVNSSLKPDPDNDIIVLELKYDNDTFRVVISSGLVLRACTPKSEFEEEWGDPGPKVLKWRQWGIKATRWLYGHDLLRASVRSTYGSRMVVYGFSDAFVGEKKIAQSLTGPPTPSWMVQYKEWRLLMFDFNPRSVARNGKAMEGETGTSYVYTKPSLLKGTAGLPTLRVLSCLPFRVATSKIPWKYKHVYMNSTTLIGRKDHHYDILSFLPPKEGMERNTQF